MNRLGVGETVAGIGGLALLVSMFLPWYGSDAVAGVDLAGAREFNAWEAYPVLDIVLLAVAVVAVGMTLIAAAESAPDLPRPPGRIAMGAGALAMVAILMRLIVAPEADVGFGVEVELQPQIGSFVGLLSAAAIAWGGWRSSTEESADG